MPQKPQHVSGWFLADSEGHPEHPIVLPPDESGEPPTIWPSPGHPEHPIVIPPLVGIWPSPGKPAHPIVLPPETKGPIYIEGTKDNPITTAPGTLQPPLPEGSVPMGTVALLVTVPGVEGERWLTYSTQAQPKLGK